MKQVPATLVRRHPSEDDMITITLSEQRPIRISKSDWPHISGSLRRIRVRGHADGRRIVYGRGLILVNGGWRAVAGGFIVEPVDGRPNEAETVRAIRRVAGIIGAVGLGGLGR